MNDFDEITPMVPLRTVVLTLILALLADLMPFPFEGFFWLPQFTALVLVYWLLHAPQWVGMGVAFCVGLLLDVGMASALGLHALSYSVMSFFILSRHRQIMLYGHVMQILAVFAALMCHQAVLVLVRLFLNHQMMTWQSLAAPVAGALLWPLLSQLLLLCSRRRRAVS